MILRNRILGLAGLLALLFLSLITYILLSFTAASRELNRIVQQNLAVERTTETLNLTILQVRSDIWDTMVFDVEHRSQQVERLDQQAKAFYQGLRALADKDPGLVQTAEDLRQLFQSYYLFGSTILELTTIEEFVSQDLLVKKFRQNQTDLLDRLSTTLQASKDQFFGSMNRLNEQFSQTALTAFILSALVTLLSFLLAILISRRLSRPLERLSQAVHEAAGGNYTVRPTPTSSGEIRELTETFVTMLDQIEDYSSRMEDLVHARTDALFRTNAIMVKELKLAQKIQNALIPQQFTSAGPLTWAGAYLPMEDLGGDFYDISEVSPGVWTAVIADVSGHGIPAALVTAMVKISLGVHGPLTSEPGRVLEEVNRELCATIGDLRRYATMVLCHIDLNQGKLTFSNAGHNELIVLRGTGELETFGPNSGVVGLRPDELFLSRTIRFGRGDSLVLFTDGLIEARGSDKKEFGLERLLRLVSEPGAPSPEVLVSRLRHEVLEFSAEQPRQDDIAFLILRREPVSTAVAGAAELDGAPTTTRISVPWAEDLYKGREFDVLLAWTDTELTAGHTPHETSRLLHWKAMAFHHRGRYEEALSTWNQALLIDPENHRARRNRGYLQRHLKETLS